MRRLRRKRRKMRQRARNQEQLQLADPWKIGDGDGDDGGDWEVFEEIIDYWDDGDGDDTVEAAAAFEKELAEFEAGESGMAHVTMLDNQDQDETGMSSSATIVDLSKWFLVTSPIWYLI